MKYLRALLVLLVPLGLVLVAPGPAQAVINNGDVYFYTDYNKSYSNILITMEDAYVPPDTISTYVERGQCAGQKAAYIPPVDTPCYKQGYGWQPKRFWTNPHWCSGYMYADYRSSDGVLTYTSGWTYVVGGANGVSTPINNSGWVAAGTTQEVRAYLVPNGAFGCNS